ncbi:hypothetical protein Y032_0221g2547 [Ancylostoma ceylanicum]|uniref:BZIP domain-containing protein n=1 Tax=Ancylostoma ceylanicum TaxID=53326 RepID=A0A016SI51_9BILA|nr:hypothetical protein Y032_0221g2547 [Ancylostoma ceylanicum]
MKQFECPKAPLFPPSFSPKHYFIVRRRYINGSAFQQQQIYEEIVRECQELEQGWSSSSSTSASSPLSSSDSGSPQPSDRRQEKREKKMAQNRTAALRYREKKKLNEKKRLDEVAGLTRRNQELKSKARFFLFDIF